MPQISHIKYSDIKLAQRFDAEYFKPEFLRRMNILDTKGSFFISDVSIITDGEHGSPDLDPNSGIMYLSGHNVKDNILDLAEIRYCSKILDEKNSRSRVKKNSVLLSIVGTVGNASVVYEDIRANTDRNVATIKNMEQKLNPYFVSTFLNSGFGKFQTERFQTGNVQPLLNLTQVRKIKIPLLSESFQLSIEEIVKSAHQKQAESKSLSTEAEKLLLTELGLIDYQVRNTLTFSTTRSAVRDAGRYDSEYFQPKYAEIIRRIEGYDGGYDIMKNTIDFRDQNFTPKDDVVYNYLALSNISNQGYIQDFQNDIGKDLPSRARRRVRTGDVIISSIEGSLSSCAIIEPEFDNAICSTGFFVLHSKKINPETLLILFKSPILQELLQRGSKGTILTAISKTELESIKIPLIKPSIQSQIAEKIQESHRLRKESRELLERAKKMVEEEIENGVEK